MSHNELAELFFANTLWLGALAHHDALWSAGELARAVDWHGTKQRLVGWSS